MRLRDRKKEEKLRRIEDAARRLFAEQGFRATKTRDIAKEAGIGAGTLFVYFPQKRDVLIHLFVTDITDVWTTAVADLDTELPLLDALQAVFGALYDYYEADRRLSRVFLQELMFVDPGEANVSQAEMTLEFVQALTEIVGRAKSRGELPATTAEPEAAYHFFGAYYFNLMGWLGGMMPSPLHRQMLRRALSLLLAGMRSTRGDDVPEGGDADDT